MNNTLTHTLKVNGNYIVCSDLLALHEAITRHAPSATYSDVVYRIIRTDEDTQGDLIALKNDIKELHKTDITNAHDIVKSALGREIERLTTILNESVNYQLSKEA